MRINLDECAWPNQGIERVVLGPDVPVKYVPYASVLHQEERHFTQSLEHSTDKIRPFQKSLVSQFQRSRHNRLRSREGIAGEVCVRQRYQSLFFVQVSDIKAEEGQDLPDIAFVDEAQAVELREARFGFPVFEVADPIVRHIVSRVFLFLYNSLAESLDIANGQMPSLAFGAETLTSFGT